LSVAFFAKVIVVAVFASVANILYRVCVTAITFYFFTVVLALLAYLLYQMIWEVSKALKRVDWLLYEAVLTEANVYAILANKHIAYDGLALTSNALGSVVDRPSLLQTFKA